MTFRNENINFTKPDSKDLIPYDLLLLADPSKDLVDEYLEQSDIFIAERNKETLGVIVLFPLTEDTAEIKNIAVKPAFQGQGIGSFLIGNVMKAAAIKNYNNIIIGTANSSIGQLHLYQKLGFEITEIRKDFFTENYTDPIFENGIQAKHLLILAKKL